MDKQMEDILDIGIAYSAGELTRTEAEKQIGDKFLKAISQTKKELVEKMKNYVDIPEGWIITKKVKKSQHHPECSWVKAKMLCDCGVIDGAIAMRKIDYKSLETESK